MFNRFMTIEDAAKYKKNEYYFLCVSPCGVAEATIKDAGDGLYYVTLEGETYTVDGRERVTAVPRYAEVVRELKAREGDPYYVHLLHGEGD